MYDIFVVLAGTLNACCPKILILQAFFILLTLLIRLTDINFFPEIILIDFH
jgi:hypothetical protein